MIAIDKRIDLIWPHQLNMSPKDDLRFVARRWSKKPRIAKQLRLVTAPLKDQNHLNRFDAGS
jgi:hypothetical protein